jgi:hypothetical protein
MIAVTRYVKIASEYVSVANLLVRQMMSGTLSTVTKYGVVIALITTQDTAIPVKNIRQDTQWKLLIEAVHSVKIAQVTLTIVKVATLITWMVVTADVTVISRMTQGLSTIILTDLTLSFTLQIRVRNYTLV